MRDLNLGNEPQEQIANRVGMTGQQMQDMFRLLAIAKYDERYVIPTSHQEQAHALEAINTECPVGEGDPVRGGGPIPVTIGGLRKSSGAYLDWDGRGIPARSSR